MVDQLIKQIGGFNERKTIIGKHTSGGDGSENNPFVMIKEPDYIGSEYAIIRFIFGSAHTIKRQMLSQIEGKQMDIFEVEYRDSE